MRKKYAKVHKELKVWYALKYTCFLHLFQDVFRKYSVTVVFFDCPG
jgi:hypothetical protein